MTPATQSLTRTHAAENPADDSTLVEAVGDATLAYASQHLIVRHRMGQRFEIEALDIPHDALASIGEQLEEAGISHALSESFIGALRGYIMQNGGAFSRAANAKPVRIHMVVADRMPKSRFDNAMTELACLGPRQIKVEGATRVNVRATPSGTATSSNAADVDAMFSQVRGLFLWVRFEAPTKEDLDGLMSAMESALAGVAQSVGGAMGAADFKKLLETLQRDGAMTPAVTALVNKLIQLQQAMGKDGKIALPAAELATLLKDIGAMMDKAQGLILPALVDAAMRSMADMAAANPAVAEFLSERGYAPIAADNDNISVEERLDAIMDKVAALAALEGLDPALAAELREMLEKAQADMKAGDITPAAMLDALGEKLTAIAARGDIPQALMDGIGDVLPDIQSLRDSPDVNGAMPDLAQGEALLALIEDIAAKIEKGEVDIDALPPEIKALIEKMGGVETFLQKEGREARIDALAEVIATKDASDLSMAAHAAVLALSNPDTIAGLPPAISALAEQFVADQPALVQQVAIQTALYDNAPQAADMSADATRVEPMALTAAGFAAAPPSTDGAPTGAMPANDTTPPSQGPQTQGAPVKIDPAHPAVPVILKQMDAILRQAGHSLPQQGQKVYANLIKDHIEKIVKGEPVTSDKVVFVLKEIDTILAKEPDPVKRQEIITARNAYVDMTRNVPGVDKNLQNGPGTGKCDPCHCDTKSEFLSAAAKGALSQDVIRDARNHFENIQKENPGGPSFQVHDNGTVTITRQGADGAPVQTTTTLAALAQSQAQNDALKAALGSHGQETTKIDDLFPTGDSDFAKTFHECGEGCNHGSGGGAGGGAPSHENFDQAKATTAASRVDRSALRGMALKKI